MTLTLLFLKTFQWISLLFVVSFLLSFNLKWQVSYGAGQVSQVGYVSYVNRFNCFCLNLMPSMTLTLIFFLKYKVFGFCKIFSHFVDLSLSLTFFSENKRWFFSLASFCRFSWSYCFVSKITVLLGLQRCTFGQFISSNFYLIFSLTEIPLFSK